MFKLFQHKISKSTKLLYIYLLYNILSPNFYIQSTTIDYGFKSLSVQLNPDFDDTEECIVLRKKCNSESIVPYEKLALFDEDREAYFHANSVFFGEEKVQIRGKNLKLDYVFDAYSYWDGNQIMVFAFRYYNRDDSKYRYYQCIRGEWSDVEGSTYFANLRGHIDPQGIKSLLRDIKTLNSTGSPYGGMTSESRPNRKKTVIVVSSLVAFFLFVGVIGLLVYLKK